MQTAPSRAEHTSDPAGVGPVGVVARLVVGIALIVLEFAWREPKWQDVPLGLVVLPSLVLAAALWSRRSSRPLHAGVEAAGGGALRSTASGVEHSAAMGRPAPEAGEAASRSRSGMLEAPRITGQSNRYDARPQ
jgi:hypothetical protein